VELRDWTSALDSKEKLLLQLQQEKMENEKLKNNYEVRMQAYEEAVKSQENVVEVAQRKLRELEKAHGRDETVGYVVICLCMCACAHAYAHVYIFIYTYIYIYIYIYRASE